jgi:pyruvate dehydrogenase (quinone)
MADTIVAFVIEHLMQWGVSRIYGYPGDGINGIPAVLCEGGDEDAPRRAARVA